MRQLIEHSRLGESNQHRVGVSDRSGEATVLRVFGIPYAPEARARKCAILASLALRVSSQSINHPPTQAWQTRSDPEECPTDSGPIEPVGGVFVARR